MSVDSTPRSKDTIWQTGLKRKIQQYVVNKRPILLKEINWLKVKGRKKIYQANAPPKKKLAGVAIFMSDKVDFKLTWSNETKKNTSY
jgi:hypothetical protein